MKVLRWIADILIALYTLFAIYYIGKLLVDFFNAFFPPYDTTFLTENIFSFIFIYGIVFGLHIVLSIWMYADFSKRTFKENSQRVFWLAMLVAGLAPLYYFAQGRKPLK